MAEQQQMISDSNLHLHLRRPHTRILLAQSFFLFRGGWNEEKSRASVPEKHYMNKGSLCTQERGSNISHGGKAIMLKDDRTELKKELFPVKLAPLLTA